MAGTVSEVSALMANTSISKTSAFPFFKLPAELRFKVYDEYFADLQWWPMNQNPQSSMHSCINLYRVCRQIHDEAKTNWLQWHIPTIRVLDSVTGVEEMRQLSHAVPRELWGRLRGEMRLGGVGAPPLSSARALFAMFLVRQAAENASDETYSVDHFHQANPRRELYIFTGKGWRVECRYLETSSIPGWHGVGVGVDFPEVRMRGNLGRLPFFDQFVSVRSFPFHLPA
jgi:hypothetical protein